MTINTERKGRPRITLYAEGASTTRKDGMLILQLDTSPNVNGRVICPTRWTTCSTKPKRVVATSSIYASSSFIWLKASWNNTFTELLESTSTRATS